MTNSSQNKVEYLYGVPRALWLNMNYIDAFKLKNELANNLLRILNNSDWLDRDDVRKNAILRAIKYNNERLSE